MTEDLKNIVESLIFVSESPITIDRLKKAIPDAETTGIRAAAQTLAKEYEARGGGFVLKEVAGGFQFRTRPEYHEWIKNLIQPNPVRLSKATLETLAIIAYKQPIIRSDIEHIRGVDCGGIIRTLLERKLIRILGRKEIPGRPLIYATTKYFLELFDLRNLKDLPSPKEIEALEGPPGDQEKNGKSADGEQVGSEDAAVQDKLPEDEINSGGMENGEQLDSEDVTDIELSPEDSAGAEESVEDTGTLDQSNADSPLAEIPADSAEHGAADLPDQDNPADPTELSPAPADENKTVPETQEQPPTSETKEPDAKSSRPSNDSFSSLTDLPPKAPETDSTPEKD